MIAASVTAFAAIADVFFEKTEKERLQQQK